jgi:two-component system, chemotaxis family, chemotaxis protein CheY
VTLTAVLIVDDSPMMLKFIERILAAAGFAQARRFFARDGNEAFELLRGQAVDLVISDINMPGLDGEGLLRRVAADERLREIPVLMVSSDSTQSRVERLLGLGARGYITKPFHPEDLKAAMERILEPGAREVHDA